MRVFVPRLPEEPPYDAIRLEELPLSFLTCDCAAEGTSFCIIFRPQLSRISEGDQLEVELLGLRGSSQRHHFFHEFRSCGELAWQDHEFFEEVQNFCKMFSDIDVFKGTLPALPKTLSRSFSLADNSLPELRPISHLSKDFKTDDMELSMYFYCSGAAAFEADLYLQRSDGKIKVDRSTLASNFHAPSPSTNSPSDFLRRNVLESWWSIPSSTASVHWSPFP